MNDEAAANANKAHKIKNFIFLFLDFNFFFKQENNYIYLNFATLLIFLLTADGFDYIECIDKIVLIN